MSNAGTTTATPSGKPKRERKPPAPMTPTKAISDIVKLRAKADQAEADILAQLPEGDRVRVVAFLEAE